MSRVRDEFELRERLRTVEHKDLFNLTFDPYFKKSIEKAIITPEGNTYDGKLLGGWIDKNRCEPLDDSPLSRHVLVQNKLFDNIKKEIEPFHTANSWRQHENNLYNLLHCPLSGEVFKDPVVAADGYTYEKSYLMAYLKKYSLAPMGSKQQFPPPPNRIIVQFLENDKIKELIRGKNPVIDLDPISTESVIKIDEYIKTRLKEDNYAGWQLGFCMWDKIDSATKLKHTLEGRYERSRFFSPENNHLHPPLHQGRLETIAEPALALLNPPKKTGR